MRGLRVLLIATLLLCGTLASSKRSATPAPRVLLFFVADDLGWNDLGSGGAHTSTIQTPTIDRLRAQGVTLSNYYTSCVCSPSRGSFLSGRLPLHMGYDNVIGSSEQTGVPLDAPLLPAAWAAATGGRGEAHALGKWHIGMYQDQLLPTARGFRSFFGYLCGSTNYYTHGNEIGTCPGSNGSGAEPVFALDLSNGSTSSAPGGPATWSAATDPALAGVYATEMYTKELKRVLDDYLERVASLAVGVAPPPLLLYVAPNNVHTPTAAPDRFVNKYNTSIASSSRRTFSGDVSALDEFVANCTTALITRGLWSNATMIFSTDNGGNLHGGGNNWPLRSGKFSLWEGGVRGQSFITGVGITRHGVNATGLMSAADWWATIVRLASAGTAAEAAVITAVASRGKSDSIDQLDMINGAVATVRAELAISVALKQSDGSTIKGKSALRINEMKLLNGFPGQSTKTGCTGGCWCPLPDPDTGIQQCFSPQSPPSEGAVALRSDPPSAACAAAMVATGCGTQTSSRQCNTCAQQPKWNASLTKAGCRVKDSKHWCNGHCASCTPPGPPGPGPAPSPPSPSPPPSALPCEARPCLFNISADPFELHDLAGQPEYAATVTKMVARLEQLRANATASLFPGGHNDTAACRSLGRHGAWAPWA